MAQNYAFWSDLLCFALRIPTARTSARTLKKKKKKKMAAFLYGLARGWSRSSFSRKRARWPINSFSEAS